MLKEERKKELKEKIFFTAIQLFKEKGMENVTITEITRECGIAKGTFYLYFNKKEHILLYLSESQLVVLDDSIASSKGKGNVRERMKLIFSDLFTRYTNDRELLKVAFSEIIRELLFHSYEKNMMKEFRLKLKNAIEENKEWSHDKWTSDEISFAIVGIYFNVLVHWLSNDDQTVDDLKKNFERHLDLLWEGL
jgi:AcrR family transcriptional regulator